MDGWKVGAKKKPMPASARHRSTTAGDAVTLHAERLQHVGAAGQARDRSVAVLRDTHAARGDDESRAGRDVERARTVATGAAGVEDVIVRRATASPRAHASSAPGRRSPPAARLSSPGRPGSRRSGLGGAALHDLRHRGGCLVAREILAANQLLDERGKHRVEPAFEEVAQDPAPFAR